MGSEISRNGFFHFQSFEAKPTAEDKPKDGCEFRHRDDQDSLDGGSTEQTEDDELNASQNSDTG